MLMCHKLCTLRYTSTYIYILLVFMYSELTLVLPRTLLLLSTRRQTPATAAFHPAHTCNLGRVIEA
jgi:hypothetical protein